MNSRCFNLFQLIVLRVKVLKLVLEILHSEFVSEKQSIAKINVFRVELRYNVALYEREKHTNKFY